MRATKFEFQRRFWIISAIIFLGFALFGSHESIISLVQHLVAPIGGHRTLLAQCVVGFGALLLFAAAWLRTWGAAYLRTDVVHDGAQHSEALVADGPFRYLRNPLYFACLPIAAAIGLLASVPGFLFMVAGNWFFVYRLIFREEATLEVSQGESYRAYCRAVPRFWPSLWPRVPSGGRKPRWAQAFMGETFVWFFGLAELSLALTLNVRLMAALFILGFVVHFIVMGWVRKTNRNAERVARTT